jgi:hypothetical protein
MSTPAAEDQRRNGESIVNTNNRRTAVIVGVLYIIGTVAGVLTLVLGAPILSAPDLLKMVAANPSQIGLVGFLVLVMGLPLAMVPAMMFPILKRENEALAMGYVIFRGALEALTYFALAMCWLLVIVVAQQYAVSGPAVASQLSSLGPLLLKAREPIIWVEDIVFGVGALMFYYLLYQTRLIPRWISGWGLVGAMPYMAAGLIAVFTGTHLVPLLLPLALEEMVMAVWLIAKGFSPGTIASESDAQPLAA